ncbi:NAD(P)H-dependent oxidoreductase [Nostoc sp. 'Peltigera malacea cyanobiont' DB3992]|uniref:NAD(P)H-dependent oxidoreductase n=1 Tax=Nostoc sp. 'Peltigera malacea cyanobiont' DB3992 TaxID=1206980 RepID=UPI000C044D37|nr:NAD(P)H-dependent oxidoreductase [Nostoc sp. 'Peltigera malacea cyanobiont' DB3992]PHM09967.1 flavodoxin [Nostoc sp. 'Peltigera malacea cyanobiont' DB3992]
MKTLIINASQPVAGMSEGKLNDFLAKVIREELEQNGHEVLLTEIKNGYDIDEEVEKHLWADVIITQSPVYWFGNPWIYKKYVDEVFNAGLLQQKMVANDGRTRSDPTKQYGTGGLMQGKKYMLSLTWNAPAEAFNDERQFLFAGKSVDDFFMFNTANYKFCGVKILPSFSCHDVLKQGGFEHDIERLKAHLAKYVL